MNPSTQQALMQAERQKKMQSLIEAELEKNIMSWTPSMKEWYKYAMKSLETSSPVSMNIKQEKFEKLLETDNQGLNLSTVATLCNNVERKTPKTLDVSIWVYIDILKMNQDIANNWEEMVKPLKEKIEKSVPPMGNILTRSNGNGLKMIQ